MRFVTLVATLLVAVPAYGQDNDAEKLYRTMEKKVRSAKGIHVVIEGEFSGEGKKGKFSATLDMAEGNKLRLEMNGAFDGKDMKVISVSDGKATHTTYNGESTDKGSPLDKGGFAKSLGVFARAGMLAMMRGQPDGENKEAFDLDKMLAIRDFKVGAKEKIGAHDTQVVQYVLDPGKEGTAKVSLWIDTKTHLPVKRELMVDDNGKNFHITETISAFDVNPKLDPKLFELPK
jgi:outer membrane lipoprotein-sorting protein